MMDDVYAPYNFLSLIDEMGQHDGYRYYLDRLAEAQNWRCCYCGIEMMRLGYSPDLCTLEHVIPNSEGGKFNWHTNAAACRACNGRLGLKLRREGRLPLNIPLCRWCGSDDVLTTARCTKCRSCGKQIVNDHKHNYGIGETRFAALRGTATAKIVSDTANGEIARKIRNGRGLNFLPVPHVEAMERLAAPVISRARLRTCDDLVQTYWLTVAILKEKYTPQMAAAPEGAPLARDIAKAVARTTMSFLHKPFDGGHRTPAPYMRLRNRQGEISR